jgi:hypothetical protein
MVRYNGLVGKPRLRTLGADGIQSEENCRGRVFSRTTGIPSLNQYRSNHLERLPVQGSDGNPERAVSRGFARRSWNGTRTLKTEGILSCGERQTRLPRV